VNVLRCFAYLPYVQFHTGAGDATLRLHFIFRRQDESSGMVARPHSFVFGLRLHSSSAARQRLLAGSWTVHAFVTSLFMLWPDVTVLVARSEALPGVQVRAVPVGGMAMVDA
jgi:hypothetical protein